MHIGSKLLLTGMAVVAAVSPALAELGGNADSVATDQQHMMAQRHAISATAYTVQEMQMPSGTVVREYLSPAGVVFAVTWNGPQMPDLQQLFGDRYFSELRSAAEAQGVRHGPLRVHQNDLVVHSGGHMRSYFGQAYVPQLVPEGVSVDELQ